MIDDFRKLPVQKVEALFNEHYSEEGNVYIAETLYNKLLAAPQIANILSNLDYEHTGRRFRDQIKGNKN